MMPPVHPGRHFFPHNITERRHCPRFARSKGCAAAAAVQMHKLYKILRAKDGRVA
jgi:hypothetical protein